MLVRFGRLPARRASLLVACSVLAFAASGCSSSEESTTLAESAGTTSADSVSKEDSKQATSGTELTVLAILGLAFDQDTYSVPPGPFTLTLEQHGGVIRHTLVVQTESGEDVSAELDVTDEGQRDSVEVDLEPGTYVLQCTVPGHAMMKSTLVVG